MRAPNKKSGVGTVRLFQAQRVRPLPNQPRKRFFGIKELAASIEEIGQTTSGLVTLVEGDKNFDAQLVDGERRLRACQQVGVPFRAEIVANDHTETIFARSFAANFGKQHHDPMEIAEALQRLSAAGKTHEQIARLAGKSDCWVSQHIRVLALNPAIRALVIPDGQTGKTRLSLSAALELATLPESVQLQITHGIKKGISVHKLRAIIEKARRQHKIKRPGPRGKTGARLTSLIQNFNLTLRRYLEMPGDEFQGMIDGTALTLRGILIKELEHLASDAGALAKAVEKRAQQRRAG
jgi:ParB/RepB/Spo0J family partition protein